MDGRTPVFPTPVSLSVTLSASMNSARLQLGICLFITMVGAGCGTPGIPEPPSLELARPVRDLKAVRKGNSVHLSWSVPEITEDHQAFRHVGSTRICRSLESPMRDCGTVVIDLPPQKPAALPSRRRQRKSQLPTPPQETYTDQLSPSLEMQSPTSNLSYAVSVLNSYGRSAGLSNQVQVPSAPTLAAPTNLAAHLAAKGIELTWSAVAAARDVPEVKYEYRVYRRDVGTNQDAVAGEVPVSGDAEPTFLDSGFEWEKTFDYRVTVVTVVNRPSGPEQVEGDDSSSVRVIAHDVFPPARPTGLQAVFSGPGQKPFVDLIWTGNNESDLSGYNVYRRDAGSEPVKLNTELVKMPAFRDTNVVPHQEYFYSISAVDARGNESPRSEEASETVPAEK
jgi:hypothetical protein